MARPTSRSRCPSCLWLPQGGNHVCGIRDERLFCWGMNAGGQLGCGGACADLPVTTDLYEGANGPYSAVPVEVAGGFRWRQVAPAVYYTCGLTTNGTAFCCEHATAWGAAGPACAHRHRGATNPMHPCNRRTRSPTVPFPLQGALATWAKHR